jgi:hypothetical protein
MLAMKTFDGSGYPVPPYRGGNHVISLRNPANWYIRRVCEKGKTYSTTNVIEIMEALVHKFFGDEEYSEFDQMQLLNLDCMVNKEAEYVLAEMEHRISSEILGHFPKIGSELPRRFYLLNKMDLIIDVPPNYEDQRGYFF